MFWKIIIPPKHVGILFENLSSADFCLARVRDRRASKMAASSTRIREHGASEKRKSWRQASSARGGMIMGMGAEPNLPRGRFCLVTQCSSFYVTRQKRLRGRVRRALTMGHFRVPPGLCMRNEVKYSK